MIAKDIKILLVDDDPFIRAKLKETLTALEFKGPFIEAVDGVEAIDLVKKNAIDFILCDVKMPNMDGKQFLSKLKADNILKAPMPILMLTAENDIQTVIECVKLGANGYLLKPWSNADLEKKMEHAWKHNHK